MFIGKVDRTGKGEKMPTRKLSTMMENSDEGSVCSSESFGSTDGFATSVSPVSFSLFIPLFILKSSALLIECFPFEGFHSVVVSTCTMLAQGLWFKSRLGSPNLQGLKNLALFDTAPRCKIGTLVTKA